MAIAVQNQWNETELGNLIDIHDDQRVPLSSAVRSGKQGKYPYYGASGIIDYLDEYILDGEYLLIAEDGENLKSRNTPVAFFAKGKFWVNNHAHIILGKKSIANTHFIKDWFSWADISGYITGSAQPKLSQANLKKILIKVPDFKTQSRVASVLSAYDDLIENNEKRIKALEEMAQLLYTEWFVKFKFPGHEKVKMVDSGTEYGMVPEGWGIKKLQDVCSKITDGSHTSPKSEFVGKPMASVKDMFDWGINIESCRKISNEDYEKLVKSDCKPHLNDVLIAKDGSYLKHIFVVHEDIEFVILSSIAILRPNGQFLPNQLAFYLKLPQVKALMKGYVSGVAIPRIVLRDFRKFQIVVPPIELQRKWAELCDPMIALCHKLVDQNANLSHTRDLLIPQLVTGKRELN